MMHSKKREQIRRTLRNLSESIHATMKLLEQMMTLINEELSLDAVAFWNLIGPSKKVRLQEGALLTLDQIDTILKLHLSIHYRRSQKNSRSRKSSQL